MSRGHPPPHLHPPPRVHPPHRVSLEERHAGLGWAHHRSPHTDDCSFGGRRLRRCTPSVRRSVCRRPSVRRPFSMLRVCIRICGSRVRIWQARSSCRSDRPRARGCCLYVSLSYLYLLYCRTPCPPCPDILSALPGHPVRREQTVKPMSALPGHQRVAQRTILRVCVRPAERCTGPGHGPSAPGRVVAQCAPSAAPVYLHFPVRRSTPVRLTGTRSRQTPSRYPATSPRTGQTPRGQRPTETRCCSLPAPPCERSETVLPLGERLQSAPQGAYLAARGRLGWGS